MDTEDDINLRVASFSYYLDTAKDNLVQRISAQENPISISSGRSAPATAKPRFNTRENFVFKMPGPVQDPKTAFSFPQEPPYPMNFERTKSTDGEITVFGAERYFNINSNYANELKIIRESKNEKPVNFPRVRSDSSSGPQNLYSETSSWNSHTALQQNVTTRIESEMKRKKATGRRFFSVFRCQGPCIDKKAVHISENLTGSKRFDHFAFPIPNPEAEKLSVKNQVEEEIKVAAPRESLEVFGSGTGTTGDIAKNLERKLSMLTWDAIPKGQNLPTSTLGSSTICDDLASDASSDLFEIENISGAVYPLLTTDQNMSICTSPPTQYAPSEASIEWSVVTASAADYSSVISDYDEKSVSVAGDIISRNATKKITKNIGGKETQIGKHGGLLGCKNHKAVDVAKTTYKTNEKAKHLGLDLSDLATGKSQAKN
ncbi:protein PHYTOCHROME KINASE SUBSTRATE 3-like, partial [Olea europaea var. sylvestris]|uniref:protein PHYTOCHROME KINASE SUBSTRATE 3-like n=1 Tax=Olea europaea var. sylvestris TaxID=158386 RepID=UPI000C1D8139